MPQDYICIDCGHEYDELGNGKCDLCGGNVIPIEEVGKEEPEEYPEDLMEAEEEEYNPPGFEEEV